MCESLTHKVFIEGKNMVIWAENLTLAGTGIVVWV